MTASRLATVLALIDQRMDALLARPDGWGSPESVELQLLLLVEFRHAALGSHADEVDGVNDRYMSFLDAEVHGPPTSLAGRLGLERRANERFVAILRAFARKERQRCVLASAAAPRLPGVDTIGPTHIAEA